MCCAVVVLLALSGCFNKELTPEEKTLVNALRVELAQTKQELSSANATAASYGGLIKLLATVRVEILKTNEALLEQRIQAIESGAKITIEVSGVEPNEALAASILNEITATKSEIAFEKADAERYGGLIKALKLSTLATREQTLAMLQQRYLSAKYGLVQVGSTQSAPSIPGGAVTASASIPEAAQPSQPAPTERLSIPPAEGPFGLAAGLSKDEIEAMSGEKLTLLNDQQNLYTLQNAPKPNKSFEQLALVVSPTVGLCQIRAIGVTIKSNSFGNQLQGSFTEMKDALSEVYGKPHVIDSLIPGSIWNEPKEWMMSLKQKERYLSAGWSSTSAKLLKNDLSRIEMEARATGGDNGYYLLQYTFNNWSACEAEEKAKARSSL